MDSRGVLAVGIGCLMLTAASAAYGQRPTTARSTTIGGERAPTAKAPAPAPAVAVAYYAPFQIMWGAAMTVERIREGEVGVYRLRLSQENLNSLLARVRRGRDDRIPAGAATFSPSRAGLVIDRMDHTGAAHATQNQLLLDADGGVSLDGEQFSLRPNTLLLINGYLDNLARQQVALNTDAVTNEASAVLLAKGYLAGQSVVRFAAARGKFKAQQTGGVWTVICDDGKTQVVVKLSSRDGRRITLYDTIWDRL
jgi:hypothetical protein